ncbi:VWA domain-containing protein [Adhaeribacter terreus]|uniref:VWA domain-containing protein n=1 Tax=Adhaeribacter terreus TaxID=529703 RepID=A0ABW0EBM1_9BACT
MLQLPDNFSDWFAWHWFQPATLLAYDWARPFFLYAIIPVAIFLLVWSLVKLKVRRKTDVAFFESKPIRQWTSYLRFLPDILFGISLVLIFLALARPQKTTEQVEQYAEGIDIMLILDTSGSMELKDFKPNRLEAAKKVAENFINGRFQDRIGLVVFAGDAYSLVPLTTDYDLLSANLKSVKLGMIPNDGTAIGSALAVAINRMRDSNAKSKIAILISDGENTAGNLDPSIAAKMASAFGMKLYTIGVGAEGTVPYGTDVFGNTTYVETRLDETNLREIAEIGNGYFYRAENQNALQEIFRTINKLEKVAIKETRYRDTREFYQVYLRFAIVFFLMWLFTKNSFLTNALED